MEKGECKYRVSPTSCFRVVLLEQKLYINARKHKRLLDLNAMLRFIIQSNLISLVAHYRSSEKKILALKFQTKSCFCASFLINSLISGSILLLLYF